jgi:hypothetical protein
MNQIEIDPAITRQMRGDILKLLKGRHDSQMSRMDDVALTHALQSLGYQRIGTFTIVTLLQDMRDRGFVRYQESRDWSTGRVWLTKVELTAAGRDQVERTPGIKRDPAVEF